MDSVGQTVQTAEQLIEFGRDLAHQLPAFAVIVLIGELGAGKTTLMKGLAEGWGVAQAAEVTSPTYTLIHEYRRGTRSLYHLDLYRIETGAQLDTLALDEVLSPPAPGEAKLVAVEWGEKVEATLPRPYFRLRITPADDESRAITLDAVA